MAEVREAGGGGVGMKPEGYPLPWNDVRDEPYWRTNLWLIFTRAGWREWQARKPMSQIIPEIDRILAEESGA